MTIELVSGHIRCLQCFITPKWRMSLISACLSLAEHCFTFCLSSVVQLLPEIYLKMCEVSESESWVKRAANRHHLEFMFSFNLDCIDETIELHIYHCYLYGLQVIHCFVDKCKFLISSQKINLKKRRKNEKNCIDSDLPRFQFFFGIVDQKME